MKLISILGTQVSRFVVLNYPTNGLYLPELMKQIKDRYNFAMVPTSIQEYNMNTGLGFMQGIFTNKVGQKIIIERLQILSNVFVVDSYSDSDEIDLFIDDLTDWLIKTFNYNLNPHQIIRKSYFSQLEIELNTEFSKFYSDITNGLCKSINSFAPKYLEGVEFEPVAINFKPKNSKHLIAPFRIDKREGYPSNSNVYYSVAPFSTKDHIESLKSL